MAVRNRERVAPLPLPSGAVPLGPLEIKTGGWEPLAVDARLDFEGITWARVEGGFGSGQKTGWHPREDWIAIVPGVALSVGRYFAKPDEWGRGHHDDVVSMEDAMREEVASKLSFAYHRLVEAQATVRQLARGIALLESSARWA